MELFRNQMKAAYDKYFNDRTALVSETAEKQQILERLPAFEHFLNNISVIKQCRPLHFGSLIDAAGSMMSRNFLDILVNTFLKDDVSWSLPADFPDLPIICPSDSDSIGCRRRSANEAVIGIPDKKSKGGESATYYFSDSFHINSSSDNQYRQSAVTAPWFMPDESKNILKNSFPGTRWVWPPCEYLLHGTAYEAGNIIRLNSEDLETKIFEGSFLDGIDIKSSIHARMRGDNNIYVYSKRKNHEEDLNVTRGNSLDPTVFIFDDPNNKYFSSWELGTAGQSDLRNYVENSELPKFDKKSK